MVFGAGNEAGGRFGASGTAGSMQRPAGEILPIGQDYLGNDGKRISRPNAIFRFLGVFSTGKVAPLWLASQLIQGATHRSAGNLDHAVKRSIQL